MGHVPLQVGPVAKPAITERVDGSCNCIQGLRPWKILRNPHHLSLHHTPSIPPTSLPTLSHPLTPLSLPLRHVFRFTLHHYPSSFRCKPSPPPPPCKRCWPAAGGAGFLGQMYLATLPPAAAERCGRCRKDASGRWKGDTDGRGRDDSDEEG